MSTLGPEVLTTSAEVYEAIAQLDPLEVDGVFQDLPDINTSGDRAQLSLLLSDAVEKAILSPNWTSLSAIAALRDLDFLMSSYNRAGGDAILEIAGLEEALGFLGAIGDTVPRGTVATYALANPSDERRRSFTGSPEEDLFIDSVRVGSLALEEALEGYSSTDRVAALELLAEKLQVMVDSVITVKRTMSPEYFTHVLRPYFDPITVNGQPYQGAGGAQLQFLAVDYLLWGADDPDPTYQQYFNDNQKYLPPLQRSLLSQALKGQENESLLKKLEQQDDQELAAAVAKVLRMVRRFRYPHKKLADDNFKLRGPRDVGSGGYTPTILELLLEKTEAALDRVGGSHEE